MVKKILVAVGLHLLVQISLRANQKPIACREEFPATYLDRLAIRYLMETPGPFRRVAAYFIDREPAGLNRDSIGLLESVLDFPFAHVYHRLPSHPQDLARPFAFRNDFPRRAEVFSQRIIRIIHFSEFDPPVGMSRERWVNRIAQVLLADWDGRNFFDDTLNDFDLRTVAIRVNQLERNSRPKEDSEESDEAVTKTTYESSENPDDDEADIDPREGQLTKAVNRDLISEEGLANYMSDPWDKQKLFSAHTLYVHYKAAIQHKGLQVASLLDAHVDLVETAKLCSKNYLEGLNFLTEHWKNGALDVAQNYEQYTRFFESYFTFSVVITQQYAENPLPSENFEAAKPYFEKLKPHLDKALAAIPKAQKRKYKDLEESLRQFYEVFDLK